MVNAYVGESYKLVFPILSRGYLRINYDEPVTVGSDGTSTTAISRDRSIWAHEGSFAIEAILTPYDVNGFGSRASGVHGVLDSTKTPPYPSDDYGSRDSTYESVSVLDDEDYLEQKMMIFYNDKLKLYLQNTTLSSYNQPAEYKIVAEVKDGSNVVHTFSTDTSILAENTLYSYYDPSAYYVQQSTSLKIITTAATGSNPSGTATITSTSLPANAAATGNVTVSGDITNYTSVTNATGNAVIVDYANLLADTPPSANTSGDVKFGANPVQAETSDTTKYIQVTHEEGATVTKWFARSSGTNGAALGGGWPAGAYQYNIGADAEATCGNFVSAVNGYNAGWSGSVSGGPDPAAGGLSPPDIVANFTAAIIGNAPSREGTGGDITLGAAIDNGIVRNQISGGIDEVEVANSYITITDSASRVKNYHASKDGNSEQPTGASRTHNGVSVIFFQKKDSNTNTAVQLKNAINATAGHGNSITATSASGTVSLTHDATGTGGNQTITKTNMANGLATVSGLSGGVNEANATNTPYIQLINAAGLTKKYVPVANGDAITTTTSQNIGDVSGAVAFQEGADATATATNLETAIEHANGHAGSITVSRSTGALTLTQGTAGTAGNKTITLNNLSSGISITSFTGGQTPDKYISLEDAAGVVRKYKAATTEVTGSSSGGYVYFRNGTNTTDSATNLETAIDSNSGHNGSILTSTASNVLTYRLNSTSLGDAAISLVSISSGITLSNPTFSTNTKEITVGSGEAVELGTGNEIYDSSATLIGTVDDVSNDTIALVNDPISAVTTTLYTSQPKEALYLEQPFKVSLIYLKDGSIEIYLNNNLLKKSSHTIGNFSLDASDCQIGRGASNAEQFYGELFEISMHKGNRPCSTTNTLTPGYSDILFYYSFGDD